MSDDEFEKLLEAEPADKLSEKERAVRDAAVAAIFERQLDYQTGDVKVGDGLATLHLGKEFRYLNPTATKWKRCCQELSSKRGRATTISIQASTRLLPMGVVAIGAGFAKLLGRRSRPAAGEGK